MNPNITTSLALALALALATPASAGDLEAEFHAREQRFLQAVAERDRGALRSLMSLEFQFYRAFENRPMIGFDGGQWAEAVLGRYGIESFEIHETRARPIGGEVVLTATRATLKRAGDEAGSQRLLTSTWLKGEDGAWKIVARVSVELSEGGWGPEARRQRSR